MEIKKYKASECLFHIRHNLRSLPAGHSYGNDSIVPELTKNNYCLIDRGTAEKTNRYRKDYEKNIHIYNRKNLIHMIELVIQVPSDCPEDQHEAFFRETLDWFSTEYLKAPDAILSAVVHKDEKFYAPDGTMISKDHMHVLAIPVVEDSKHDGYQYKLCADALTKSKVLRSLHSDLQDKIDSAGIKGTVYKKKMSDGKTIPLSVQQLKEITARTGIKIDHSLTVEEFADILKTNQTLGHLREEIAKKENKLTYANTQIEAIKKQEQSLQKLYDKKKEQLHAAEKKIEDLNRTLEKEREQSRDRTWGDTTWGSTEKTNPKEEEHLW